MSSQGVGLMTALALAVVVMSRRRLVSTDLKVVVAAVAYQLSCLMAIYRSVSLDLDSTVRVVLSQSA